LGKVIWAVTATSGSSMPLHRSEICPLLKKTVRAASDMGSRLRCLIGPPINRLCRPTWLSAANTVNTNVPPEGGGTRRGR
jgi:hypothetical protein